MTSSGMQNEDNQSVTPSDFSIDHILNRAGSSNVRVQFQDGFREFGGPSVPFTWLQCSRYCPPKVPRKREGPQKRQLGRHPRIPFTSQQLAILEDRFRQSPYLSSEEVTKLSSVLHLADIRVKIWFQNRRARERREKNQPELKSPTIQQQALLQTTSQTTPETSLNIKQEEPYHQWFQR